MAGIDEKIPGIGTPWEGYKYSRVEEFIKAQLAALQAATEGKVGWITYENGNIVFYDSEGGTQLGIVPLSGTVYAITLTSTTPSSFYVLKDDTVANINVTPSTKSGTLGGEMTPFAEDYRWSLLVDNGGGSFVEKASGDCLSGATITQNVRNYLSVGTNRVKVAVTGKDSQQTKTTTFTASVTSLTLTSRYNWNNPWIEGEEYAINGLYFSGNLQKTLYVRIDDDDEQTYTRTFPSGTNYTTAPYEFIITDYFPDETGVHTVEIWLAGDGVETQHYRYNVMCVQQQHINQVALVCINEIINPAVSYETQRLFRFATYNATQVEVTLTAQNGNEAIVVVDHEAISVQTQTKVDYTKALEVDIEGNDFKLTIAVSVEGQTAIVRTDIDNSQSYAAVEGAVFYMNAANRSNGSADRAEIINAATGASVASYEADWTNMSWSTDGWYQDSDSNKCLVVKAGSTVGMEDLTPLTRASVGSVSIEFKYRCSNISDYDTPILSMMSTPTYNAATTNGIILFPTRLVVLSSTDRQITPQTVQLSEDRILHVVVVLQRLYKATGRNLCRIYINGVQQCVFEYDGTGSFGSGPLRLGQASADLYLYTMRIYNQVLESESVKQNFLNSIIDGMDYTRSGVRHDNNIMDGGAISYDLCKAAGFNTMVIQMQNDDDIPSLTNSTGGNSTVWLEYADHPTWNVQITNAPISGQGTTSMRYYRWNLRNKLKKSSAVWHYADGSTDNVSGYIAGKGLHPKVNDIVAKKNVASSMQGHKMGACNMFDELFKAVGLGSGLPSEDVRVSIYQYPMLGFQKYADGSYKFIGLYTVGPAKNDAGTRGYDTTTYPSLLSLEGPNHAPLGTRFLHPWIDVTYDYTQETLCFGGEEAWDVGACRFSTDKASDAANVLALFEQEWKPAYNIAYLCSPFLVSLSEAGYNSLSALNADIDNFRASRNIYGNKKNDVLQLYDGNYNLIYYRTSTGKYEVLANLEDYDSDYEVVVTHNIKAYLGTYLTAITSSSSPTTAQLRAARIAKFKAEASRYWSINAACYHEAFCELIACSDNHAKNSYPQKWKSLAQGGRWIWCQDDMDTILPTDNNGQQTKSPSVEVGDVTQDGVDIYQGSSSSFWEIINHPDGYQSGVKDMLQSMVTSLVSLASQYNVNGPSIHESVMNMMQYYFWAHSAYYFPLTAYNADADWSYIDVWELDPTAVYNNVPPLRQANGTQLEAERKWVEWHIVSLFSKYGIAAFTGAGDDGMGRLEFTPAQSFNFAIKPAVEMYPTGNRGGGTDIRGNRTPAGTACTITATSDGTTTFYIKGVDWYTDLGDLSGLALTTRGGDASVGSSMSISGKRLQRVKVGDAVASNVLFNAGTLNISGDCIEEVDCRNVVTLNNAVSLSGCPRLRVAKFAGSSAPNLVLPIGGKVSEVTFPDQLTTLFLHTLPMLDDEHMTLSATAKAGIAGMYVNNCAQIDFIALLNSILNTAGNHLHFVSLIWEGAINMTGAEMELLAQLAEEYDADGNTGFGRVTYDPETGVISNSSAHALLQGTINVTTPMYEDTLNTLRAYFGNTLTIVCDTYYIRFEDAEVMRICAVNWGDYHWEPAGGTGSHDLTITPVSGTGKWDLVNGNYVLNRTNTGAYNITATANAGAGAYNQVADGITPTQAAAVSSLGTVFANSQITKFNELALFTGVRNMAENTGLKNSTLSEFVMPAQLRRIEPRAFADTTNLNMEVLEIPTSVNYIWAPYFGGYVGKIYIRNTLDFKPNYSSWRSIHGNSIGTWVLDYPDVIPLSERYGSHYFYVPDNLLQAYKTNSSWSSIANRILPISELPD